MNAGWQRWCCQPADVGQIYGVVVVNGWVALGVATGNGVA
jgi:hypothetical protein